MLSQVPLLAEDLERGSHLYPQGRLDQDLQQVDMRDFNSWRMTLADVPTAELLEVHLVNAVAPFVLNARLRPLLAAVPTNNAHVVNVSAMEGQFYRRWKTDKHPHTNMAKAALNMMTRTSAADYIKDGIHMNSVDTGWVTDEDPFAHAERKQQIHGLVDYINAHGTSTPHSDRLETLAVKHCFGQHAARLAVASTKSMSGHLLGAAGGLEAGITALSPQHQVVPPTITFEHPDEDCDLDYVPGVRRELSLTYALSNSFGFGGTNATARLPHDVAARRGAAALPTPPCP